jgi:hypothetical protein
MTSIVEEHPLYARIQKSFSARPTGAGAMFTICTGLDALALFEVSIQAKTASCRGGDPVSLSADASKE